MYYEHALFRWLTVLECLFKLSQAASLALVPYFMDIGSEIKKKRRNRKKRMKKKIIERKIGRNLEREEEAEGPRYR